MPYISVFPSWQATILSFPGSSNCFKCFLGRCQAWRPRCGGERKGSVRRRVFGAQKNGLDKWQCYKACEMWNMGGRLWELISNTWQLFETDQHQFSVIFVTPDPATRALGSHIRRTLPGWGLLCDLRLHCICHYWTGVGLCDMEAAGSQSGISHFAGVDWMTELSSLWNAKGLP